MRELHLSRAIRPLGSSEMFSRTMIGLSSSEGQTSETEDEGGEV